MKIKHRRCPFINEEIKEKMAKRDQAHKIAREKGALVDCQYYRDLRNDVKRVLREAEKEYVQNEVKKNQSSSERWKVIRNCIPIRETSRPAYFRDMKELATEFNEFFTELGVRAAEQAKRLPSVRAGIMPLGISDHSLVYLIRKTRYTIPGCAKIISTRSFKNFKKEAFLADIELIQWDNITLFSHPNKMWEFWKNQFLTCIDKHAPMR